MDKFIFLDFDGVLSSSKSKWCLQDEKIELVKKVVDATNAKIIITSTWRLFAPTIEMVIDTFVSKDIRKDLCEWLKTVVIGVTSDDGNTRGEEIQNYIDKHGVVDYVIIDDTMDFLDNQLFNFVQTDFAEGITDREVNLAIQVLNNESITNPIRLNLELNARWRINTLNISNYRTNIEKLLMEYKNKFRAD